MTVVNFDDRRRRAGAGGPQDPNDLGDMPELVTPVCDIVGIAATMAGRKDQPALIKLGKEIVETNARKAWDSVNKAARSFLTRLESNTGKQKRIYDRATRERERAWRNLQDSEPSETPPDPASQSEPGSPEVRKRWTTPTALAVTGLSLVLVILLASTWNVIAARFIESGQSTFDYPNEWRAYVVAALFLFLPLPPELLYLKLSNRHRKIFYFAIIGVFALAAAGFFYTFLASTERQSVDLTSTASIRPVDNGMANLNLVAQVVAELTIAFLVLNLLVSIVSGRRSDTPQKEHDRAVNRENAELELLQQMVRKLDVATGAQDKHKAGCVANWTDYADQSIR